MWNFTAGIISAILEACSNALLIADQFHLLMNLSDALDACSKSISWRIRSVKIAFLI